MGNSKSLISKEQLEEYSELTYLTKVEILYIFDKFSKIDTRNEIKRDFDFRFRAQYIMDEFPMLKYNPFRKRIFYVFSSYQDDHMSFEDFLNLCSVMSENCPLPVKASWAFKMFDFNGDNQITRDDLARLLECLVSPQELTYEEKKHICDVLLENLDLSTTGGMSQLEFSHAVAKMPEFANSFYFKV